MSDRKMPDRLTKILDLLRDGQSSIDEAAGMIANQANATKSEAEKTALDECLRFADGLLDHAKTTRRQIIQVFKEIKPAPAKKPRKK